MKINQPGTLFIVGVVLSITAACGGNPVKPAALASTAGDGAPSAFVNVTAPRLVDGPDTPTDDAAADAPAEAPAEATTEATDESGSAAPDEAKADEVVMDETAPADDARFVSHLYR